MKQTLVLGLVVVGLTLAGAIYVHPDGVDGVLGLLGIERAPGSASDDRETSSSVRPTVDLAVAAERQIRYGDEDYDKGRFEQAFTAYLVAYGAARTDAQKERAHRGQERAVLAWALTYDPPAVASDGLPPRARLDQLLATARSERTEEAWLDAASFAAASGMTADVRDAVASSLDLAVGGGAVESRLRRALAAAGTKRKCLIDAMKARGLGAGLVDGGGPTGMPQHTPSSDDSEPSGIGGVGAAPRVRVPFGDFDTAMRERLKAAAEAEADGYDHYDLSGPDGTDREMHRREAHRLLKEARDVYNEALEADPEAHDVERRLHKIMVVLGQLNKERVAGD